MLYAIIAEDRENSLERRLALRPEHLARLQKLFSQGRGFIAGGLPAVDAEDPGAAGYTGSLIIAEFESLEAAREWAEADIFWRESVWATLTVKPLRKALP